MRLPSGEKAGVVSSFVEPLVRLVGFFPPTRCQNMSVLPASSPTYTNDLPSGARLQKSSEPSLIVSCAFRAADQLAAAGALPASHLEPSSQVHEASASAAP